MSLGWLVEDLDLPAGHFKATVDIHRDGSRIDLILDLVNALLEALECLALGNPEGFLNNNGAVVHFVINKMDGHAGDLCAVGERILDAARAFECWQERRMNVEDLIGIFFNLQHCTDILA